MKRIIPTIPLRPAPIRRSHAGFAQSIMGKYGMSRWRDRILAFVFRKNRPLFEGGTDEQGSRSQDASAGITRIYHSHIHQPVYRQVHQAAKNTVVPEHTVRPIVMIQHNSITNVTRRSIFAYHPLKINSEKVVSNFKYSGSLTAGAVRMPAGAPREPGLLAAVRPLPVRPVPARAEAADALPGRQEFAGMRQPELALPARPSAAAGDEGGQDGSLLKRQPQQGLPPVREAAQELRLVGSQLRTLQAYAPPPPGSGQRPAPASPSSPVTGSAPKGTLTQYIHSSSGRRTAAKAPIAGKPAEAGAAPLVHAAGDSPRPAMPGLQLVTGNGLREALGGTAVHIGTSGVLTTKPGNRPTLAAAGAEPLTAARPQPPAALTRLLHNAVSLQGVAALADNRPAPGAARPAADTRLTRARQQTLLQDGTQPEEEAIVHLTGGVIPALSARQASFARQGAAIAAADHPFPLAALAKSGGSGLIHRMQKETAPDLKMIQQAPQAFPPPDREVYASAAPARRQEKGKQTADVEEINRLAERVYQVLEKRIGIQKDRRGLR